MNIYIFSGLGADQRIFQKLIFPSGFVIHHVPYQPVSDNTTLSDYARTLSAAIDQRSPFILIGLSFGGLMAIEIAKQLQPEQTILISSLAGPAEVRPFFRWMGTLGLHKWIPVRRLLRPGRLVFFSFGANTQAEKELLRNILADTDPGFFRWAIGQLFSWSNEWKPRNFLHIHGSGDRIIPLHPAMQALVVNGGTHLMVYSKACEITGLLAAHLKNISPA